MVVMFVISLIAGMVMIAIGKFDKQGNPDKCAGWGFVLAATGTIFLAVWISVYVKSYMELTKMEAFYDANRSAYEATVETTKSAIYQISKQAGLRIDVENLQQSTNWSDRVAEFRDAVVEYNTCIYKLRRYNTTWILQDMFPNPRSDLKLILLQE